MLFFLYSPNPEKKDQLSSGEISSTNINHYLVIGHVTLLTIKLIKCTVDGKWTVWKSWEPCSVTCGGGVQMSGRTCTNPAPAFGGADCEGVSERSRSCNERGCPGKLL